MTAFPTPRGRWWDDPGLISEADARAEAAVTAWETAERDCGDAPREGKCPSCGLPSDDDLECLRCERSAYDASGVPS